MRARTNFRLTPIRFPKALAEPSRLGRYPTTTSTFATSRAVTMSIRYTLKRSSSTRWHALHIPRQPRVQHHVPPLGADARLATQDAFLDETGLASHAA